MTIPRLKNTALSLPLIASALFMGCGEDPIPPEDGDFADEASAGANEAGSKEPDVGVGELDPGECIAKAKDGEDGEAWGYVHQCGGRWWGRIGFTFEGTGLDLYVPSIEGAVDFGDGHESYLETKVMACCGQHDPQLTIDDQPTYAENCMLDLRQQVCRSISEALGAAIDSGELPSLKPVVEVQHWIATHIDECIDGLVDTDDSPKSLKAKWEIPQAGTPWDDSNQDVEDVYIEIFLSLVNDLYRPADLSENEICTSLMWNNGNLFERGLPSTGSGMDATLESGSGVLLGPPVGSAAPLQLSTDFGSLGTACTGLECSKLSLSFDSSASTWSLDELRLILEPRLVVDVGGQTLVIEDAQVELYGDAQGQMEMTQGSSEYRVLAGDVQFIVRGQAGGGPVMLFAHSSTDLVATSDSAGGWELRPFELLYTEAQGDAWTMTVGATQWL